MRPLFDYVLKREIAAFIWVFPTFDSSELLQVMAFFPHTVAEAQNSLFAAAMLLNLCAQMRQASRLGNSNLYISTTKSKKLYCDHLSKVCDCQPLYPELGDGHLGFEDHFIVYTTALSEYIALHWLPQYNANISLSMIIVRCCSPVYIELVQ